MNRSSPTLRAWSALAILSLSACSLMPSPGPTVCIPAAAPPECLQTCGPMPAPTGPGEAEMMRWELQTVHWGERCLAINRGCIPALLRGHPSPADGAASR